MNTTEKECESCKDTGHVCENHPGLVWEGVSESGCDCGGAGMPCPKCCSPVLGKKDFTSHVVILEFTPDKFRL